MIDYMKTDNEIKEFILSEYHKKFKNKDDKSSWDRINKEIECFSKNSYLQEFYSIYEIVEHIKGDKEPYGFHHDYNALLSAYVLEMIDIDPREDGLSAELYLDIGYINRPSVSLVVRPTYLPSLHQYIVDNYVPSELKELCKLGSYEIFLNEEDCISVYSDRIYEFFKVTGPIEIDWELMFNVFSGKNLTYKQFSTPLLGIPEIDSYRKIEFINKIKPNNKNDLYRIFTFTDAYHLYKSELRGVDINYLPTSKEEVFSIFKRSGIDNNKIDVCRLYLTNKKLDKNDWDLIRKGQRYPDLCVDIITDNRLWAKGYAVTPLYNALRMLTYKLTNTKQFYDAYFASMIPDKVMNDARSFSKEIKIVYANREFNDLPLACAMLLEEETALSTKML